MLGAIRCVTVCAPDLDAVRHAYGQFLGYEERYAGAVTAAQAEAWQCAEMVGAPTLVMSPSAGDEFQFRFVERVADPNYVPLTTWGWNASEIMVRDVDAMAERVQDSPFEIVGEPRDLSFSSDIRAMQIRGPGDEIVYLTQFKKSVPGLDVPVARCDVDRTFIVIVGGESMDDLQNFYANEFGITTAPVVESRITMLSKALGVSIETLYPIAALTLQGQCLIEADEMPAHVGARHTPAGLLPPGIAIVTFDCDNFPAAAKPFAAGTELPYGGASAAVLRGAAGEIIELVSR